MPLRVFYSYSHQDDAMRQRLNVFLRPLVQQKRIVEWHDRKIDPGADWASEINSALKSADIILLGLRVFVWVNFILRRLERQAGRGFARFSSVEKSGMIFRWLLHANASVCPTHTASTDSVLSRSCAASSAIRLHASSHLSGAKKNALQGMCSSMSGLRPQASSCERFAQWRLQNLSGPRSAPGPMSMR